MEFSPLRGKFPRNVAEAIISQESGQFLIFTTPIQPPILSFNGLARSFRRTKTSRHIGSHSATLTIGKTTLLPPSPTCWRSNRAKAKAQATMTTLERRS